VTAADSTESELLDLSRQLLAAVSAGDWTAYRRLVADDLTCFEPEARGPAERRPARRLAERPRILLGDVGGREHEGIFDRGSGSGQRATPAGTKGLCRFSWPTVVGSPWPGNTIVSSGRL